MTQVVSSAGEDGPCEGFLELPPLIYRDDPRWVPEEPAAVSRAFSAANAWFETGRARTFAIPGAARMAAFRPALAIEEKTAAFFGYYESTGDASAIAAVTAAAETWARSEGAQVLFGPIDFATAINYRLRTSDFEATPFLGEPYNPARYNDELLALGFEVAQRYVTIHADLAVANLSVDWGRAAREQLISEGYRYESLTPDRWLASMDTLYVLVDQIFAKNFGYTKLLRADFEARLGERYARRMDPDASIMCVAPDGSMAGLLLFYPDWGALISQAAGPARVAPSELDFAIHFPQLAGRTKPAGIMKTLGVADAHRRKNIGISMSLSIERAGDRYPRIVNALMREDNPSRKIARAWDGERWYALYSKPL